MLPVYVREFVNSFLGLDNFVYSKGSIVAQWEVILTKNSNVTNENLKEALTEAVNNSTNGELIGGYPVDEKSISSKGKNIFWMLVLHHCTLSMCSSRFEHGT